jgi:alanine racemase
MNMCIVDVTNTCLNVGDSITVYSREKKERNSIQEAAKKAKMIPYELCVRISESIRRKIVD